MSTAVPKLLFLRQGTMTKVPFFEHHTLCCQLSGFPNISHVKTIHSQILTECLLCAKCLEKNNERHRDCQEAHSVEEEMTKLTISK